MLVFKKLVVALICVIATIGSLSAQVQVIDLWSGKVPGVIQSDEFKQHVDTTTGWIDKHSIVKPDLYFYPAPAEKATGTAVVICPGGGYSGLAIRHEGLQVAQWFNSVGITAFVLNISSARRCHHGKQINWPLTGWTTGNTPCSPPCKGVGD